MTIPSVSVVIVSRHRPVELIRCLKAVSQLYYPNFEIVVVADADGLAGLQKFDHIRKVAFDQANISTARNLGIAASAGEIVAFIDDDAAPEPTWLDYLTGPLAQDSVVAAGGYVIGRNGFSLQWGPLSVDRAGWDTPIDIQGEDTVILSTQPGGQAIKTQGTNMAIRRSVLFELGGFDPAFRYFQEESDLNMRIALAGHLTAVVPMARVLHSSAPSERRRSDRVPLSLFDVGASSAAFHRKYLKPGEWAQARDELRVAQNRRLCAMMIEGRIEPRDVQVLTDDLLSGYDEGLQSTVGATDLRVGADPAFSRFARPGQCDHKIVSGSYFDQKKLDRKVLEGMETGSVITKMLLAPDARYHRVRFRKAGYWEHTGGVFGRAARHEPLFRWTNLRSRTMAEMQRIAPYRNPVSRL